MKYHGFNQNVDLDEVFNQINHWANKFENEFNPKSKEKVNVNVTAFKPVMDIYEQNGVYTFEVELPGLTKNDVNIKVNEDGVLTISGNKNKQNENEVSKLRQERKYGEFSRSIQLANDIDINNVNAKFENGILTLTINKKEPEAPKVIEVQIS